MSHQVKFVLWIMDDQSMQWIVIRSCDVNELLALRKQLLDDGVECTSIKKERLQ